MNAERPAPRRSRLGGMSAFSPPSTLDGAELEHDQELEERTEDTSAATDDAVQAPIPAQEAPQSATEAPEAATATKPREQARKAATAANSTTDRLGIYLTPQEFTNAKAAYLADWNNGGTADTYARWIAAAIDTHARRTPAQRATAPPKGRSDSRTGSTRSFSIPTDTVTKMRAAITADQQAGRWLSDSAWCGEAISRAVDDARTKNGGRLPDPPPRLPNRLVR